MGLLKKKQPPTVTELKCLVEGCPMTCNDADSMKRHTDWKHPELAQTTEKVK